MKVRNYGTAPDFHPKCLEIMFQSQHELNLVRKIFANYYRVPGQMLDTHCIEASELAELTRLMQDICQAFPK